MTVTKSELQSEKNEKQIKFGESLLPFKSEYFTFLSPISRLGFMLVLTFELQSHFRILYRIRIND